MPTNVVKTNLRRVVEKADPDWGRTKANEEEYRFRFPQGTNQYRVFAGNTERRGAYAEDE